jgi:hypothetical protein
MAMIKALVYSTLAVILGVAMTLLPTWLFLITTDQPSFSYVEKLSSGRIPLLSLEDEISEPFAPQWPGIVWGGLITALAIYVLVKRRGLNTRDQKSPRLP